MYCVAFTCCVQENLANTHPRYQGDGNLPHIRQLQRQTTRKTGVNSGRCFYYKPPPPPRRLPGHVSAEPRRQSEPFQGYPKNEFTRVQNKSIAERDECGSGKRRLRIFI